jgi:hypothetical protein
VSRQGCLIDPLVSFDTISRDELNRCLGAWGHKMGPITRPEYRAPIDFGIRHHGELVAVVACDSLIRATCGFEREDAFEVSRLCAVRPYICRAAIRIWREFAYPDIARAWGAPWAISYQNAVMHRGDLYRFDGWQRVGWSSGGSDPRAAAGTVSAKKRVIWGWHGDHTVRANRKQADEIEREESPWPAWTERDAA